MATNLTQQLDTPAPPNLGTPDVLYSESYFRQTNGGLNVYFNKLRNLFGALLGPRGGKFLNLPYGAFQDTTDQNVTTTSNEYIISCNTTDYSNGVVLESTNKFRVRNYGIYNIQFSIQFANADNQIQDVDIWFKKGSGSGAASNIAGSNSKFSVPESHGGTDGHLIAALNFFLELQADDYVQLAWSSTDTDCGIEHLAAQTSPTRPATPSVIVTVNYIAPAAYSNIYVSAQQQGQATISHYANSTADKTYAYILVG